MGQQGGEGEITCWRPRAREGSRANLTRTLALGARKPDAHLQHSSRRADMAPRAPRGPPTEATLLKRAGQRSSARCRRRIDASGGGGALQARLRTALLTTGEQNLPGLRAGFSREISLLARTYYEKLRSAPLSVPEPPRSAPLSVGRTSRATVIGLAPSEPALEVVAAVPSVFDEAPP